MEGIFITFEGVEGSGKSTQAARLFAYLEENGHDALLIREPGSTKIGEQIRGVLLDSNNKAMDDYAESCLYAAARSQLVHEIIKPAIAQGKIIICDRFVDSSLAYQAMARGLGFDMVYNLNQPAVAGAMPHVTVLVDITPEQGLKRRQNSGEMNRLDNEKLAFHKKVYEGYHALSARFRDRYLIIDGSPNEEAVFQQLIKALQQKLLELKKEVIL